MLFSNIDLLLPDMTVGEGYCVRTEGERIISVSSEPLIPLKGESVFEGKNKLLLPGFVNLHSHIPMTIMRGYGEGLSLHDWLHTRIFPFEAHLDSESIYWSSMMGIGEMLKGGITSFSDMYYFCEDILRAVNETGISCNISRGISSFQPIPLRELPSFQNSIDLYNNYHGSRNGAVRVDMCIHAEYTSNPEIVRELAEYVQERHIPVHIHLSETKEEHDGCIERHGQTPAQYFSSLGLFEVPVTAAHCVWVTPEDMDILKEKGVTVAHCPASNLKLGSGVAPVPDMIKKGIPVALGTDGAASNNALSILHELHLAVLIHGTHKSEDGVTRSEWLRTLSGGALAQGRPDTGEIREGAVADLAVIDFGGLNQHPVCDKRTGLLYSTLSSDIILTMCRGRVVYADGELIGFDHERVVYEVGKRFREIVGKL